MFSWFLKAIVKYNKIDECTSALIGIFSNVFLLLVFLLPKRTELCFNIFVVFNKPCICKYFATSFLYKCSWNTQFKLNSTSCKREMITLSISVNIKYFAFSAPALYKIEIILSIEYTCHQLLRTSGTVIFCGCGVW